MTYVVLDHKGIDTGIRVWLESPYHTWLLDLFGIDGIVYPDGIILLERN